LFASIACILLLIPQGKIEQKHNENTELREKYTYGYIVKNIQNKEKEEIIIPGDSFDTLEKERIAKEEALRIRTDSYTGSGTDVKIVGEDKYRNCVKWFKAQKNINTNLGYAGNIKPNSQTPRIGAGALERNHISLVIAVGDNWVRVRESNWVHGMISERTISTSKLRGFLII